MRASVMLRWVVALTALTACDDGGSEGSPDAAPPDAEEVPLEPCASPGVIFGYDDALASYEIAAGGDVPLILGFQGFLFAQVGLRSSASWGGIVMVRSVVRLEDGTEIAGSQPDTAVQPAGGAWQTEPVLVFINDVPRADLYDRPATLTLAAPAGGCLLIASLDVRLVEGGVQAAEDAPPVR